MDNVAVAAGVGVGAMLCRELLARRLPPSWQATERVWQWRGCTVLFFSMLTLFCIGVLGRETALYAVGAGVVIAGLLHERRVRYAHRVELALAGMREPATRTKSVAELCVLIGPAPRRSRYRAWASVVLHIAASSARAGCPTEALSWAERVDPKALDPVRAAIRAQVIAASCIALRDRTGARKAIAGIARPIPSPIWERAFVALQTLLEALDADPREVEKRARGGAEVETDPIVKATWMAAHAHALAALGHRDESLEVLTALRDLSHRLSHRGEGPCWMLERVAHHGGPASSLAESLLIDSRGVYR
jgi:hypothetical protein